VKRRRTIVTLFVAAGIGFAAAFYYIQERPLAADVLSETMLVGETTRSYRLVVPHMRPKPCPVVFAFHGAGDSADSMAAYARLDGLAAESGFVLVYPAGRGATWQCIEADSDHLGENLDIRFFDALLNRITMRFNVDIDRVCVIGMSNGASFAQLLAHARSRSIAGVVAHSGAAPPGLPPSNRQLPVLLIAGADDPIVDAMRTDLKRYNAAGHDVELIIVEGLGHEWSTQHNERIRRFVAERRISR